MSEFWVLSWRGWIQNCGLLCWCFLSGGHSQYYNAPTYSTTKVYVFANRSVLYLGRIMALVMKSIIKSAWSPMYGLDKDWKVWYLIQSLNLPWLAMAEIYSIPSKSIVLIQSCIHGYVFLFNWVNRAISINIDNGKSRVISTPTILKLSWPSSTHYENAFCSILA